MKRMVETIVVSGVTALAVVMLGFGPAPTPLRAQSTRMGGRDVPVVPFEQWFKRLGLLNATGGCDAALEFDSTNVARFTDCADAGNLRDMKARTGTLTTLVATSDVNIGGAAGAANADRLKTYRLDSVADATGTAVFTVTVPNGIHGAVIPVTILTALGTGGAVGDFECTGTAYGQIVVERFTGAATVATATTLSNTGSACSAGATTIATAYAVSSMTGAVGATQTFTVNVTVTKGGGASGNHHVIMQVDELNANATGITIS